MNVSITASEPYPLTDSARAVFRCLSQDGPSTRPVLSQQLGLSRPTMSAAMSELSRYGLVSSAGAAQGHTGRSAVRYALAPGAGHVLAIELGATRVRVEALSLDSRVLAAAEQRLSSYRRTVTPSMVTKAAGLIRAVLDEVGDSHGALRDAVVVAPTLPSPLHATSRRPEGVGLLDDGLGLPDNLPYLVENNVNCAALAEHRLGVARSTQDFLYLQVGVKIGLGIVLKGELLAGAHGAAGEIAHLPFPWAPDRRPRRLGLEHFLGSDELIQRCRQRWPRDVPAPRTASELFRRAEEHDPLARELVAEHAENIGMLVVAAIGIVDPEMVVLGGGVGENELMLQQVRRTVARLAWDTDIRTGTLGARASILGAGQLAVSRTLARLT